VCETRRQLDEKRCNNNEEERLQMSDDNLAVSAQEGAEQLRLSPEPELRLADNDLHAFEPLGSALENSNNSALNLEMLGVVNSESDSNADGLGLTPRFDDAPPASVFEPETGDNNQTEETEDLYNDDNGEFFLDNSDRIDGDGDGGLAFDQLAPAERTDESEHAANAAATAAAAAGTTTTDATAAADTPLNAAAAIEAASNAIKRRAGESSRSRCVRVALLPCSRWLR
jgi:hypothetical protein